MKFAKLDFDTMDKALELWGEPNMYGQAQEECGELIVALSHLRRGRRFAKSEVVGELADVLIVAEHLRRFLGCDTVDTVVREKLDRLQERVGLEVARRAAGHAPQGDTGGK